ncbi:hypothetical protein AB0E72_28780, partial [Streptomyces filamentosus]
MTSGTGPPAPYGRDRELALLAGLLHAAGPDGGEPVVCVAGGPGEPSASSRPAGPPGPGAGVCGRTSRRC